MRSRFSRIICLSVETTLVSSDLAIAAQKQTTTALSGLASVYDRSSGRQTASGEQLQEGAPGGASFSSIWDDGRVANPKNGRRALVCINDAGPFVRGRLIDLTPGAARVLGVSGLANVSLEVVSTGAIERHHRFQNPAQE